MTDPEQVSVNVADDPCCTDRPEGVERMVRFGYYLSIAANLLTNEQVKMLVDADYHDPRDVCREASKWCYGTGRDIAVAEDAKAGLP